MEFMNIWKRKKPSISFEFYPSQTEKGNEKLHQVISDLIGLTPDFMSVTFGAGGSSREGSLELLQHLRTRVDVPLIGYLAAYGLSRNELTGIAGLYQSTGIDALLAVRGDIPQENPIPPHPDGCPHAVDLVQLLKRHVNIPVGIAAYPEGHVEAGSRVRDWEKLLEKVSKGGEFIITQFFYDNRDYYSLRTFLHDHGVKVPILAGIMPIYSIRLTRTLAEKCGASIPEKIRLGMETVPPEDKEAVTEFGVNLALEQCRDLLKNNVDGLHFYTMDRSQSIRKILLQLKKEKLV